MAVKAGCRSVRAADIHKLPADGLDDGIVRLRTALNAALNNRLPEVDRVAPNAVGDVAAGRAESCSRGPLHSGRQIGITIPGFSRPEMMTTECTECTECGGASRCSLWYSPSWWLGVGTALRAVRHREPAGGVNHVSLGLSERTFRSPVRENLRENRPYLEPPAVSLPNPVSLLPTPSFRDIGLGRIGMAGALAGREPRRHQFCGTGERPERARFAPDFGPAMHRARCAFGRCHRHAVRSSILKIRAPYVASAHCGTHKNTSARWLGQRTMQCARKTEVFCADG